MTQRQESVVLQVTHVGNHALDWVHISDSVEPSQADTATSFALTNQQSSSIDLEADDEWSMDTQSDTQTSQTDPTTEEELFKRFEAHLLRLIYQKDPGSDGDYAGQPDLAAMKPNAKRNLIVSLALAREYSSAIRLDLNHIRRHRSLESYLEQVRACIRPATLADVWYKQQPKMDEESAQQEPSCTRTTKKRRREVDSGPSKAQPVGDGRTAQDLAAQKTVKKWYGKRCVLTGCTSPHGAHIVPVHATADRDRLEEFWETLQIFWPLDDVNELKTELNDKGHEFWNILPLGPNAHQMWDRMELAIRPIQHSKHPKTHMFIQFVWLTGYTLKRGLNTNNPNWKCFGGLVDFRRQEQTSEGKVCFSPLMTGDVFEIVTKDSKAHSLPSFRFLNLQYHLHRVMRSIRAASALRIIFRDNPPDIDPLTSGEMTVPGDWAQLLECAVEEGVLDSLAAAKWARAFAIRALKDHKRRLESRESALQWWKEFQESRAWKEFQESRAA
jgi:hypothetical protein